MSNELYNPVEFYRYDKISDDIIALGKNAVLRFNIGLASYNEDKKYFFYKEYEISSKSHPTISIKRSYDYYLSIENYKKQSNGSKVFIRIGLKDFILLKNTIDEVVRWFTDKKYAKLFVKNNNSICMTAPIPSCRIDGLPMNSWLLFEPTVIDRIQYQEPGVCLTLSDSDNITYLTFDTLLGLQHILSTMNMYQCAISILSSIPAPLGTNRTSIGDGSSANYKFNHNQQQNIFQENTVTRTPSRRIGQLNNIDALGG